MLKTYLKSTALVAATVFLSSGAQADGFDQWFANSSWYATSVEGDNIPYKQAQLGQGACAFRLQLDTVAADGDDWLLIRAPSFETCEDGDNKPMHLWVGADPTGELMYYDGGESPPLQSRDQSTGFYDTSNDGAAIRLVQTDLDLDEGDITRKRWRLRFSTPTTAQVLIETYRRSEQSWTIDGQIDLARFNSTAWGTFTLPVTAGTPAGLSLEYNGAPPPSGYAACSISARSCASSQRRRRR